MSVFVVFRSCDSVLSFRKGTAIWNSQHTSGNIPYSLAQEHRVRLLIFRLSMPQHRSRFNTFQINLLGIPSLLLAMFTNFGITLISELYDERTIVASMEDLWTLPCLVALYLLPADANQWIYYVSLYLSESCSTPDLELPPERRFSVGQFPVHACDPGGMGLEECWRSRKSDRKRISVQHVSLCFSNFALAITQCTFSDRFVQASAIICSYIYRSDDAPQCMSYVHCTDGNPDILSRRARQPLADRHLRVQPCGALPRH